MNERVRKPQIDLTVHHKSPKSGQIIQVTPYRLQCVNSRRFFEKPAGSKQWFYENGEPVAASDLPEECKRLPPVKTKLTVEQENEKLRETLAQIQRENAELKEQQGKKPGVTSQKSA